MLAINRHLSNFINNMKKEASNLNGYYTDPILYEEGFFKDKKDEQKFLKKVENLTKNKNGLSSLKTH